MKKSFEYIGLTVLFLFSYYYTDKIASIMSDKDTIMVNLEEIDDGLNKECIEGYITDEGVVLGISGLSVDMEKSYHNMKGFGFNKDLIEYKEENCVVNKKNSLDRYIIKGNSNKNSVSLILNLKTLNYIESFINIAKEKEIELSIIINENMFNEKKEYFLSLNEKYDYLYNGNNIKIFKELTNTFYCIDNPDYNMLETCKKENINTIKSDKYYSKNALSEIKKNVQKGDLIILEENKTTLNEFSTIINYITSKGIKIQNINNHLK